MKVRLATLVEAKLREVREGGGEVRRQLKSAGRGAKRRAGGARAKRGGDLLVL